MARHAASALRWFAFFKTKVEEKSPFLFHFSSTPHLSLSHVAPSHASFCPLRPLCLLALGQPLRTPLGHSLPIPQIHRSLLSGLRHATCPFRPPARSPPHGLALQLFPPLRRPPRRRTRISFPPQEPTLSYSHLTDRTDHLWLHHAGLAHCPQPVRSLKNILMNPSSEKHQRTDRPTHFPRNPFTSSPPKK